METKTSEQHTKEMLGRIYRQITIEMPELTVEQIKKIDKIIENHLRSEPAKEGIVDLELLGYEESYQAGICGKKPSEQGGGMLQPGEYMRDNEGNITTYEDEQKKTLKDSQPKECEGCKEKTRIINDLQQQLYAEYGIR